MVFQKNNNFLFILTLLISVTMYAQDVSTDKKKEVKIKAKTTVKPTDPLHIDAKNGFKNAYKNSQAKYKKIAKEKALLNKGVLTQEQLNNFKAKELYGKREIPKVDSHQGDFLTNSKSVTLAFRDFGQIDGDVIAIYVNDVPVVKRTTLYGRYKSYQIQLEKGNNTISIIALNQGALGANTAQYRLTSEEGLTIASQHWFLATGAKATFSIYKGD